MDLSASTHPRFDGNNDAGALVKVLIAEPNVKFEGNIIGVPEFKTNEYWVYLTAGTKFFVVKVPNAIPVHVSFADCKLPPAQSRTTYELVLSRVGQTQNMNNLANSQYVLDKVAEGNRLMDSGNLLEAYTCFMIACDAGNKEAKYNLTKLWEGGKGIKWCKESAKQGYVDAQKSLGYCYEYGIEVKKNNAEALKWYRKAAEKGNTYAQVQLGDYYKGYKIYSVAPYDYDEAVKWYRQAAEQGDKYAQYCLGYCYEFGQGVTMDYNEAMNWYEKATSQTFKQAEMRLDALKNSDKTNNSIILQLRFVDDNRFFVFAQGYHKSNNENIDRYVVDHDDYGFANIKN